MSIKIRVGTFVPVKLKECFPHGSVIPRLISITMIHGGKDVNQAFRLSSFPDNFLNPANLALLYLKCRGIAKSFSVYSG